MILYLHLSMLNPSPIPGGQLCMAGYGLGTVASVNPLADALQLSTRLLLEEGMGWSWDLGNSKGLISTRILWHIINGVYICFFLIYIFTYVYARLQMSIYIYLCLCIHIYIYTHTYRRRLIACPLRKTALTFCMRDAFLRASLRTAQEPNFPRKTAATCRGERTERVQRLQAMS